MYFSKLVAAIAVSAGCSSAAPHNQFQGRGGGGSLKFPYGSEKVRGVNLGGVSESP